MSESLSTDEIWPDGDAPENPTVDDVRAVFFRDRYNVHQTAADWGFEITEHDVTITDDNADELLGRLAEEKRKAGA